MNIELLVLQCDAQARLDGDAFLELPVHRGIEKLEVVPAAVLGLVHGRIGVSEQLAHVRAIARKDAHADTHRRDQRPTVDDHRIQQRFVDATRGFEHLLRGLDVLQHDDEFVAAHAHDHVLGAHRRADTLRDGLQQLVARLVSPGVVDMLEAIEIQKQHREHLSCLAGLLDRAWQMSREEQPVRQTRELVMVRQVIQVLLLLQQLRFHFTAQADVVRGEAQHAAAGVFERVAADLDVLLGAVLASLAGPDRHPGIGIAQPHHQVIGTFRIIDEQLRKSHFAHLGRGEPEAALQCGIRGHDLESLGIHQQHAAR